MALDIFANTRKMYENRDKGLTVSGEPSREVQMKQGMTMGMGNTNKAVAMKKANPTEDTESLKFLKQNQNTDAGQALGYAVDMVQRTKNTGLKDPSEYMKLLSGSEEFRKLKPEDQQLVRRGFRQWVQTQNVFNTAVPKRVENKNLDRQKAEAKKVADMISIF